MKHAGANTDASDVTRVAIHEIAARRGHDYITLCVDIDESRVVFATEGKDARTVAAADAAHPEAALFASQPRISASNRPGRDERGHVPEGIQSNQPPTPNRYIPN